MWHNLKAELRRLATQLPAIRLDAISKAPVELETYFCHPVMDLARFLREATHAQELGSQHHTLKILFKYLKYGEEGQLEHTMGGDRMDIYLPAQHLVIEVKTITEMTLRKLFDRVMGVINTPSPLPDYLWVFFFYKLREPSPKAPECQYLLTFISINLMGFEKPSLLGDLSEMVEESRRRAADKLEIPHEYIIPLENLLKVEDLERVIDAKDRELSVKEQELQAEKDKNIAKDQEILRLKAQLKKFQKK